MIQQLGLLCDRLPPLWAILVHFPLQKQTLATLTLHYIINLLDLDYYKCVGFLSLPVAAPDMTYQHVIR